MLHVSFKYKALTMLFAAIVCTSGLILSAGESRVHTFAPLELKVESALIPSISVLENGMATDPGVTRGLRSMTAGSGSRDSSRVALTLDVPKLDAAILQSITATGTQVLHSNERWNSVSVLASAGEMTGLAQIPGVRLLQLSRRGRVRQAGSVPNQADATMNADQARQVTGATGAGQKIGVLSDSCNQTLIGPGTISGATPNAILSGMTNQISGDLPAQIQVIDFGAPDGLTDEGSAMMELIHDVAPNAALVFAAGTYEQTTFAENILKLGQAGCTIICDDEEFLEEPYFQDGPASQAITANYNLGIAHFSSAGNDNDNGIMGTYTPVDSSRSTDDGLRPPSGKDFHDWGLPGASNGFLPVIIPNGFSLNPILQWNQPFQSFGLGAGSSVNLDMYLFDAPNIGAKVLAKSEGVQFGGGVAGGDPLEEFNLGFGYANNTGSSQTVYLALNHFAGSRSNVFFRIVVADNSRKNVTFPAGGDGAPSIFGHCASVQSIACGAIFYGEVASGVGVGADTTIHAEGFSSKGGSGSAGIPYYFDASGGPLSGAPQHRNKPDITAIDGVHTSFFHQEFHVLLNGTYYPLQSDHTLSFLGTSAAAPNAAAVAALLMERAPLSTPGQIKQALQSTARLSVLNNPVTPPERIGAGLIDASAAIQSLPIIVTSPTDQYVTLPQSASFSVTASGPGTLSYQWRKNGVNISGQTQATLTLTTIQKSDDGSMYACIVSNANGTMISASAALHVKQLPAITQQPADQTVLAGASAVFTVAAVNGTLSYQWLRNGAALPGQNSATLNLTNVQKSDDGALLSCSVSNGDGTTVSSSAVLRVKLLPAIVQQPADQTVPIGASASFTVSAINGALLYQWKRNSVDLAGQTNATLNLTNVQKTDDGSSYMCVVSNADGMVSSLGAVLHVFATPPIITQQPISAFVLPGASVTFSVAANNGALSYQWQRNGVIIPNATAASYTLLSAQPADSGAQFLCVVSNAYLTTVSTAATLLVDSPPVITSLPTANPSIAGIGSPVTFTVSGNAALGQTVAINWDFGDGTSGTGASVAHVFTTAQTFNVNVTLTDPLGLSATGALSVLIYADSNGDGLPDVNPAIDNSGYANLAQQIQGLSPQAPGASHLTITLIFNAKGNDSLTLSGALPFQMSFTPSGQHVVIVIGGFAQEFILDKRGRASAGINTSLQLQYNARSHSAQYTLRISKASLQQFLAASGLTNKTVTREPDMVRVTVFANGAMFDAQVPQKYTSKQDRMGRTQ